MPQKYRVTTDQGTYEITVGEDAVPVSLADAYTGKLSSAQHPIPEGGNTGALASTIDSLRSVAHPESVSDFLPLLIPSGTQAALGALKEYADIVKTAYQNNPRMIRLPAELLSEVGKRWRAVDAPRTSMGGTPNVPTPLPQFEGPPKPIIINQTSTTPHLDLATTARPSELTAAQLAERIQSGTGTATVAAERAATRGQRIADLQKAVADLSASPPSASAAPATTPATTAAVAALKPKLTLEEFKTAQALAKEGYAPEDILTAIQQFRLRSVMPEAWKNLPTDADVWSDVTAKNANTTVLKGGSKR